MPLSICPTCGVEARDMKHHKATYHREKLVCNSITLFRNVEGFFDCTLCSYRIKEYGRMQNHLRRHPGLENGESLGSRAGASQSSRHEPYPTSRNAHENPTPPRSLRGSQRATTSFASRLFELSQEVSVNFESPPQFLQRNLDLFRTQ
jgi:hypothetical protein